MIRTTRPRAGAVIAAWAASALAFGVLTTLPAHAGTGPSITPPALASAAADDAARWLAAKFDPAGYVPVGGPASVDGTVDDLLAIRATSVTTAGVAGAVPWLQANFSSAVVKAYLVTSGADNPGRLAKLILVAVDGGVDPTDFDGTASADADLVARLLATMRTSGPDTGLFGTASASFDGAFRQGLALAALGASRTPVATFADAVTWLVNQQCSSGAWVAYRSNTSVACKSPDEVGAFGGWDPDQSALASLGLSAVGGAPLYDTLGYFRQVQGNDGGWTATSSPTNHAKASSGNSTGVVTQAIIAAGVDPATFVQGGRNPYQRLLAFQITSGPNAGGIAYLDGKGADTMSTQQVTPALAGRAWPLTVVDAATQTPPEPDDSSSPGDDASVDPATDPAVEPVVDIPTGATGPVANPIGPAEVLGEKVGVQPGAALPFTGAPVGALAACGALAAAAGATLLVASRRQRAGARPPGTR